MITGVKFCGGCNPRYDRRKIMQMLMEEFPDLTITNANETDIYDFVVVICGCPSQCAEHEKIRGSLGKVVMAHESDYGKVRQMLAMHMQDE